MCVAYPGTVIRTYDEGRKAAVDFSGTRTEVQTGFIPVKENDRVLVHAGCVLQVLPKEEAEAMDEIFAEIEALQQEALEQNEDTLRRLPQEEQGIRAVRTDRDGQESRV